ncbi:glycosyltransferase family 4 protein [Methylobacterium isbiliense]|uniref:D-inositol-3-phosphate glycosyltransferase n=1 Tax=Methylobacterium isbiliense TaxID=315478 RepID=A0ABQ4SCH0_9HYPH|nr:glycosyltransferase family 4 protein [Methylobacterium isbiliense]MDN3621883.1 glycosyltransferase family 4 protein [Methylobacterium isbiliense]GJD99602.1 D-inositol-3-phosphate glycosyltransferase [Methylobacterium isbiliense]
MHIVLVLDHAHVNGGQAKVAIDSAVGLRARGHDVTLFAAVGPVDPRLTEAGVEVVCLGQDDLNSASSKLAFAAQVVWNAPAARALAARLSACDPARTLVHVHGWAKALSPAIGRVLARCGLPVTYTMHEFFLVCPNGGFYDFRRHEICHRTPLSGACIATNCDSRSYAHKALRLVRHVALDRVSGMRAVFRHVVTISALQESVITPHMPPGTVFHRVDNPIPAVDHGPKPVPGEHFLFVGRLSPEKGAPHFAEAARQAGLRSVFVGDGPSGAMLRARYPEAVFLGWKSPAEVAGLMRAARALVFPSVWYEGQPLTVYEALATGTPVIVSDACAGREAVADGETGLWFPSGDAAALAAHLRTLSDDGVARRMSAAAHARYWAAPLSLERHLDRLTAVYTLVQADHAARAGSAAPAPALARAALS